MLVILARGNAKVGDIHEWDAGHERPFDGAVEGFGGDAGVGEVAVEETGGTGYLVEGEPAASTVRFMAWYRRAISAT